MILTKIYKLKVCCDQCNKQALLDLETDNPTSFEVAQYLGWLHMGGKLFCSFECWAADFIMTNVTLRFVPNICGNQLTKALYAIKEVVENKIRDIENSPSYKVLNATE